MPSVLTGTTRPHHRLHDSPKIAPGHRAPSPTTTSGLTPTSAACTSPHFVPYFHCNRPVLRFVEAVGREGDASDAEALSHVCLCLCLCFRGWREERFGETSNVPDGAVLRWYAFLATSNQIYGGEASEETNHVRCHVVPSRACLPTSRTITQRSVLWCTAYPPTSFFREIFPVPYHTDECCT